MSRFLQIGKQFLAIEHIATIEHPQTDFVLITMCNGNQYPVVGELAWDVWTWATKQAEQLAVSPFLKSTKGGQA